MFELLFGRRAPKVAAHGAPSTTARTNHVTHTCCAVLSRFFAALSSHTSQSVCFAACARTSAAQVSQCRPSSPTLPPRTHHAAQGCSSRRSQARRPQSDDAAAEEGCRQCSDGCQGGGQGCRRRRRRLCAAKEEVNEPRDQLAVLRPCSTALAPSSPASYRPRMIIIISRARAPALPGDSRCMHQHSHVCAFWSNFDAPRSLLQSPAGVVRV